MKHLDEELLEMKPDIEFVNVEKINEGPISMLVGNQAFKMIVAKMNGPVIVFIIEPNFCVIFHGCLITTKR